MEQSTNMEACGNSPPVFMEHRWGQRMRCQARAQLSAGDGISGTCCVRDVSTSGAFIETTLDLPMHTRVILIVQGNESATHGVEIAASVSRVDRDGVGVEWCETPAGSICPVLGCTARCTTSHVMTDGASAETASGLLPTTRAYKTRENCAAFQATAGVPMQIANFAQDEIEETFARIDENGDRRISFSEFARLMLEMDHARSESALHTSFDAIDTDHDGYLSFDEFRAWCR